MQQIDIDYAKNRLQEIERDKQKYVGTEKWFEKFLFETEEEKNLRAMIWNAKKIEEEILNEIDISKRIALETNGKREVTVTLGKIDVLTRTALIEVKEVEVWKTGIRQLIAYGFDYPNRQKILYLYPKDKTRKRNDLQIESMRKVCKRFDVVLKMNPEPIQ